MTMSMTDTTSNEVAASWAKSSLERAGLNSEVLLNAMALNEHGHKIRLRNDLGDMNLTSGRSDDLLGIKTHVEYALSKTPSRRWLPALRRNQQRLLLTLSEAMQAQAESLDRNLDLRAALGWREWVALIEAELVALKRRQVEAQATLSRTEEQLRGVQAEIEAVLNPKQEGWFGRLKDTLFSLVSQGVGIVTQVMNAGRLVNDREEMAFELDAIAAATTLLQEAVGFAQDRLDGLTQLHARVQAALNQLDQRAAQTSARLRTNPFARVDMTSADQSQQLSAALPVQPANDALKTYAEMSEAELLTTFYRPTQQRVHEGLRDVSLLSMAEMKSQELLTQQDADGRVAGERHDLAMDALELANSQAGQSTLALRDDAIPTALSMHWLAGVPDATNTAFSFGSGCILVSTNRPDQLQFLRVGTGLELSDLADFVTLEPAFETALSERNFYANAMMADHVRNQSLGLAAFALGLACECVSVQRGQFVALLAAGEVRLGATAQQAIAALSQQHEVAEGVLDAVNNITPRTLAQQLEAYLNRPSQADDKDDALGQACAAQVRERLALAREQLRFEKPEQV